MKKLLIIYLFVISSKFVYSNDNINIISPGMKLGYVFGEHGGFTWGFELSYVNWVMPIVGVGPTLNIDYFNRTWKFHLNAEVVSLAGMSAGPTLIYNDQNWHWGYNVSVFAGLNIYLYYNITIFKKYELEEAGFLFKAPILITGKISAG